MPAFPEKYVNKFLVRDSEADVDLRLARIEIRRLLDQIIIRPPVLDMGIGHGVVASAILEKLGVCDVVEGSETLLDEARHNLSPRLRLFHSDFEVFSPESAYQTVFATGVLHHVDDPLLVLQRAVEWLAPDGQMILSVPNSYSYHRAMGVAIGAQETLDSITETGVRSGVARVFSRESFSNLARQAGLFERTYLPNYIKLLANSQMFDLPDFSLEMFFDIASFVPAEFHANLVLVVSKE